MAKKILAILTLSSGIILVLSVLNLFPTQIAEGATLPDGQSFTFENSYAAYTFTNSGSLIYLSSLTEKSTGIAMNFSPISLWDVDAFLNGQHTRFNQNTDTFDFSYTINPDTGGKATLQMVWQNSNTSAPLQAVTLTVDLLQTNGATNWTATADMSGSSYSIFGIEAPAFALKDIDGNPSDDVLAIPNSKLHGEKIVNPASAGLNDAQRLSGFLDLSGFLVGMQFFALYDEPLKVGLYVATHDIDQYIKAYRFKSNSGQNLEAGIFYYSDKALTGKILSTPYKVTLTPFLGDWYDASMIYKKWVMGAGAPWLSSGLLKDNSNLGLWLKNVPLIIAYYTTGNDIADSRSQISQSYQQTFNLNPLAEGWFDWYTFDPNQTKLYVPKPSFNQKVDALHALGGKLILWMSSDKWPKGHTYCSNALGCIDEATAKKKYGYLDENLLNTEAFIIPTIPAWLMYPNSTAFKLYTFEYTHNDVYRDYRPFEGRHFDALAADKLDFSSARGHEGGGKWADEAVRSYLTNFRNRIRALDSGFIMDTENTSEIFIGAVDMTTSGHCFKLSKAPAPPEGSMLPMFPAVYHEYNLVTGSDYWWANWYNLIIKSLKLGTRAKMLHDALQTQSYIYGNIIYQFEEPISLSTTYLDSGWTSQTQYLKVLLNRFPSLQPYLRLGQFLRPLSISGQRYTTNDDSSGLNNDIYTLAESVAISCDTLSRKIPYVMHSVWKNLNDGTLALVFANWNDQNEPITYTFDPLKYNLGSGQYNLYSFDENGKQFLSSFSSQFTRTETIPARNISSFMIAAASQDNDSDAYFQSQDCNDNDNSVYPGATELCDQKDNDCDGVTDEGCQAPPPPPAPPIVALSANDNIASEPGTNTGNFVISRTGDTSSSLTVYFSISGTAANGSDYSQLTSPRVMSTGVSAISIQIQPINDLAIESSETVTLTLTSDPAYIIGTPNSDTVTISDDDSPAPPPPQPPQPPQPPAPPPAGQECTPGQTRACGLGRGECRKGTETCISGKWSGTCVNAIPPKAEICDQKDNDCDGQTDEAVCICAPGATEKCGVNLGICRQGTRACDKTGNWGSCVGGLEPKSSEICGNNLDDNCNGATDEDCEDYETLCVNGIKDAGEDAIDCGGKCPNACAPSKNTATLIIIAVVALALIAIYFTLLR